MNPTAIKSLVKGYTHNDSMSTICIQAKHKRRFIEVPVKCTTKPFELVHSDVCSPFSTPTFGDNRYYILLLDYYTRYRSVWLLPNKKAVTCTSSYHTRKDDLMRRVTHRQDVSGMVIHSIFDAWHYEVLWTCAVTRLL